MEKNVEEVPPNESRKRALQKCEWKREKERIKRYSASNLPERPSCGHNSKIKCLSLSMRDIAAFHKTFYEFKDKIYQDNFILKHCCIENPTRIRIKTGTGTSKSMSIKYTVRKFSGEYVQVCKSSFLKILQIKKGRVTNVLKRHKATGLMARETRGGDRKKTQYKEIKEKICDFIKGFKGVESHYCRTKSRRTYLPSELNITKIYKMFVEEHGPNVKKELFRTVFNTKFNIGFQNPRSDVCSQCLRYQELIKIEKNEEAVATLRNELKVHKKRGDAFFQFLKEVNPEIMTLSFDCQKNQNLPKIPDQATYYSRQLYIYNFTIVKGSSHDKLTPNNVFSYVWTEDKHAKGANEISSALYDCLTNVLTFDEIKTLRLMCDGCPGQNKNSILISVVSKWLACNAPTTLKRVEVIFPVPGHSYIPPDRVFGSIEKQIKSENTIVKPEEYVTIFRQHATVKILGIDANVYDWKTGMKVITKDTKDLHFKITECKRIVFTRLKKDIRNIVVRGEKYYNTDMGTRKCITKDGKYPGDLNPPLISSGIPVKAAKVQDVTKLLRTHFGQEWPNMESLKYYKDVIFPNITGEEEAVDLEENLLCEEHSLYEPPTELI